MRSLGPALLVAVSSFGASCAGPAVDVRERLGTPAIALVELDLEHADRALGMVQDGQDAGRLAVVRDGGIALLDERGRERAFIPFDRAARALHMVRAAEDDEVAWIVVASSPHVQWGTAEVVGLTAEGGIRSETEHPSSPVFVGTNGGVVGTLHVEGDALELRDIAGAARWSLDVPDSARIVSAVVASSEGGDWFAVLAWDADFGVVAFDRTHARFVARHRIAESLRDPLFVVPLASPAKEGARPAVLVVERTRAMARETHELVCISADGNVAWRRTLSGAATSLTSLAPIGRPDLAAALVASGHLHVVGIDGEAVEYRTGPASRVEAGHIGAAPCLLVGPRLVTFRRDDGRDRVDVDGRVAAVLRPLSE